MCKTQISERDMNWSVLPDKREPYSKYRYLSLFEIWLFSGCQQRKLNSFEKVTPVKRNVFPKKMYM